MAASHPYYPTSMELPGFVPAFLSQGYILGVFTAVTAVVFAIGWKVSGTRKYLTTLERLLVCWWLCTGLIHMVLEGYFVFTPDFYKLGYSNFLAEVWKEYGLGDSRYPGRDTTVVIIEGITAVFEGPAALLAVYAILYRKPYSYPIQLATSLGQVYGTVVYYATSYFSEHELAIPGRDLFLGVLRVHEFDLDSDSDPHLYPVVEQNLRGSSEK
ncbi:unnamed protein product [Calypogeia fissa]